MYVCVGAYICVLRMHVCVGVCDITHVNTTSQYRNDDYTFHTWCIDLS